MKKSNKKLVLTAILSSLVIGALSTTVSAQRPKHGQAINHEQVLNELNLSDDVRASLQSIMNQQKEKMDSMREHKKIERYQAHKERKALHEAHKEQVKAILTEEQFAAFEQAIWMQRQQYNKGGKMHAMPQRR